MVEFELLGVYGGWDQAVFGPSDQVDYVVRTDAGRLETYDSVHSILKLYDLARLERAVHPRFFGFGVTELEAGIAVEMHGLQFETTYGDLRTAMDPFLAELFAGLDDETAGNVESHVRDLSESDEVLVDVPTLRADLEGGG